MPTNINIALVKKLAAKPPEKTKDFRDASQRGFIMRAQPTGTVSYYAQVARGRRKRIGEHPTFTVQEARTAAKNILAAAQLKQLPGQERKRIRLDDFIEAHYRPWAETNLKGSEDQFRRLRFNFSHLYNHFLDEIDLTAIERWRSKALSRGVKPTSINRCLNPLRSVLSRAVEWDYLEHHPLANMKQLKVDRSKPIRTLDTDERERFLEAIKQRSDFLRPFALAAYYTGMRYGEITSLEWRDINFGERQITLRAENTKTGTSRSVPINDALFEELTIWNLSRRPKSKYVFPGKSGERRTCVRQVWLRFCRDAGLGCFQFKSLRSDACSRLIKAGVSPAIAQRILGHADISTTIRYYTAIGDDDLTDAISRAL
jgi:integrase